ncbi:hypothetical protein BC941DRAFT_467389 [Chlamydoabsidia padenii]|nr:hypothetical protein BC941DRAFT_467389 [Chlamydoabsidia padenii]
MVLAGQNLSQPCHGKVAELNLKYWTIIMCVVVAIPFVLVKSMKEMAWMSAFGLFATVVVILIVLVMAYMDEATQMAKGVVHDSVVLKQFPAALVTTSFTLISKQPWPSLNSSLGTLSPICNNIPEGVGQALITLHILKAAPLLTIATLIGFGRYIEHHGGSLTGFRNKPIYELAWYFLTILLGIVGLIFGTKDAIERLIKANQEGVTS